VHSSIQSQRSHVKHAFHKITARPVERHSESFRGARSDHAGVGFTIALTPKAGGKDGYGTDLPLEHSLDGPITLDARALNSCHPMLALRLRLFIDWHISAGRSVVFHAPTDRVTAQHLADLGVADGLPVDVLQLPSPDPRRTTRLLPIRLLQSHVDIEEIAQDAIDLLHRQAAPLGSWGNALHMAVSELCDNALQHGFNTLGTYVGADRLTERAKELRLTVVDLGIGIPEHIRHQHPEWQDDTAAIARALEQGVTGTGDRTRGNGLAAMLDEAMQTDLVRASSAALIDVRSSKGRVGVRLAGGTKHVDGRPVDRPRRGTWITYTVTTV
jgi:anti-sigma regulatory factor (Ser/Thr protein kinase)